MCEPDAEQAIKEMNGFQFNSTRLVVRRQEPRKKYVFYMIHFIKITFKISISGNIISF